MFARFGACVLGRRTYDLAERWHGTHPLNGVPVFILTSHPDPDPPSGESKMTFITDGSGARSSKPRLLPEARTSSCWAGAGPTGVGGGPRRRTLHPRRADLDRGWRSSVRQVRRACDRARAEGDVRGAEGCSSAVPRASAESLSTAHFDVHQDAEMIAWPYAGHRWIHDKFGPRVVTRAIDLASLVFALPSIRSLNPKLSRKRHVSLDFRRQRRSSVRRSDRLFAVRDERACITWRIVRSVTTQRTISSNTHRPSGARREHKNSRVRCHRQ
jgi:hypothetical protein